MLLNEFMKLLYIVFGIHIDTESLATKLFNEFDRNNDNELNADEFFKFSNIFKE